MTRHNPTDRSKLCTKRHVLTDKNGIPLSVVISSANTHDIKLVTDLVDNSIKRQRQRQRQLPSHKYTRPPKFKDNFLADLLL